MGHLVRPVIGKSLGAIEIFVIWVVLAGCGSGGDTPPAPSASTPAVSATAPDGGGEEAGIGVAVAVRVTTERIAVRPVVVPAFLPPGSGEVLSPDLGPDHTATFTIERE